MEKNDGTVTSGALLDHVLFASIDLNSRMTFPGHPLFTLAWFWLVFK